MRTTRLLPCVALAVASIALLPPSGAGAAVATGTLDLKGGICLTTSACVLVGDDGGGNGAVVPVVEVPSQSKVPACESDAKTVGIAIAAYEAENPTKLPKTSAGWKAAMLSSKNYGPLLQSWPNEIAVLHDLGRGHRDRRTTGDHVKTVNGDVLVNAVQNANRSYDATVNPVSSCQHLNIFAPTTGAVASDASTHGIVGIACPPGRTTCYGVTQLVSASEGGIVAISVSSPTNPTVAATQPVAATTSLSSIACPTGAECVAVGSGPSNHGVVVSIASGVVGSPTSVATESYQGIACASTTLCFAAGTDVAASEGVLVPIHVSGTLTLGTPVDVPSTVALAAVACPTATSCVAVGQGHRWRARPVRRRCRGAETGKGAGRRRHEPAVRSPVPRRRRLRRRRVPDGVT